MKALITGATGFVGGHLAKKLLTDGWECRCLVRNIGRAAGLEAMGAELRHADVTDPNTLRGVAEGADAVFHLAAYGNVSTVSGDEETKMRRVNVEGTHNMLMACVNKPIKKFVHFSSTAAFGLTGQSSIDEDVPCAPLTAYQHSKFDSESILKSFCEHSSVPGVIIRPCMIYGPGGHQGQFLKLCRMFKRGVFPRLPGQVWLPMVHVSDVVAAALAAFERGATGGVYLIAGARPVSVHDFRRWVVDTLDMSPPYIYAPASVLKTAAWAVETLSTILRRQPPVTLANVRMTLSSRRFSTEKARREIAFVSSVEPEQGVRDTVRHLMDEHLL